MPLRAHYQRAAAGACHRSEAGDGYPVLSQAGSPPAPSALNPGLGKRCRRSAVPAQILRKFNEIYFTGTGGDGILPVVESCRLSPQAPACYLAFPLPPPRRGFSFARGARDGARGLQVRYRIHACSAGSTLQRLAGWAHDPSPVISTAGPQLFFCRLDRRPTTLLLSSRPEARAAGRSGEIWRRTRRVRRMRRSPPAGQKAFPAGRSVHKCRYVKCAAGCLDFARHDKRARPHLT
jgi:hypothetical protein